MGQLVEGQNVPDLGTGSFNFSWNGSAFTATTNTQVGFAGGVASGAYQDGIDSDAVDTSATYSRQNLMIGFGFDGTTVTNSGVLLDPLDADNAGLVLTGCNQSTHTPIDCLFDGSTQETLLVADAVGVGFIPGSGSPTLQILWEITGGTLAGEFAGNFTTEGDPLLDNYMIGQYVSTGFPGNFDNPFSSGTATVDHQGVFVLPIPPALPMLLGAMGLLGFLGYRRRASGTA
ncbi:hypothetical protein [Paralimibaculum aggregatum]|nr:hypothetical protein [Limibaculum sp. NKW23]